LQNIIGLLIIKGMDTSAQKLGLIHWITELEDDTTLDVLSVVKEQTAQEDWWNNISIAEKTSIEKGLADLRADRTITHSEVKKRYEKWLM
jgi:hypothetical protein